MVSYLRDVGPTCCARGLARDDDAHARVCGMGVGRCWVRLGYRRRTRTCHFVSRRPVPSRNQEHFTSCGYRSEFGHRRRVCRVRAWPDLLQYRRLAWSASKPFWLTFWSSGPAPASLAGPLTAHVGPHPPVPMQLARPTTRDCNLMSKMTLLIALLGGLGIGAGNALLMTLREVYTLIPFYAPRWTVYAGLVLRIAVAGALFALLVLVSRSIRKSSDGLLEISLFLCGAILIPIATKRWFTPWAKYLRPKLLPSRTRGSA